MAEVAKLAKLSIFELQLIQLTKRPHEYNQGYLNLRLLWGNTGASLGHKNAGVGTTKRLLPSDSAKFPVLQSIEELF